MMIMIFIMSDNNNNNNNNKEYKTRHNWVGKVIHWELCKKLNVDHTTKWYMHKQESILENEMHKILWDFEIQKDHLIPARRPDLLLINKKKRTCQLVGFAVSVDHWMKLKESEKIDKELKKHWNMRVKVIPIVFGALGMVYKNLEDRLEELEIRGRPSRQQHY